MKVLFLVPLLVVITTRAIASPSPMAQRYIKKYLHLASQEKKDTGIPKSIILGQGIIESGCGKSPAARNNNNHFGITATPAQKRELLRSGRYTKNMSIKYKVYETVEESFRDHSEIIARKKRCARLIKNDNDDYKTWAVAIARSGYASNPNYAKDLIACIERNHLSELDKQTK
jgi:flagellum-specific peptidoglycan hydrolase FlgJ